MVVLACARHRLTITLDPLAHFINSQRAVILPKSFPRQADREDQKVAKEISINNVVLRASALF